MGNGRAARRPQGSLRGLLGSHPSESNGMTQCSISGDGEMAAAAAEVFLLFFFVVSEKKTNMAAFERRGVLYISVGFL